MSYEQKCQAGSSHPNWHYGGSDAMKDSQKTKPQLIEELELMRQKMKKGDIAKTRGASAKQRLKDSEIRYRRL